MLIQALVALALMGVIPPANDAPKGGGTPGAASTTSSNAFTGESTFNAPVNCGTEVIAFASTMNIDASTRPCKSIAATGNFTLTTSNLAPTRVVTVTITADGTDRTMTFPAGWTWVGTTTPGTILASSTSVVEIRSGTSADSGVRAKYWTKDGNPLLAKQMNLSSTTPLSLGSNAGLTSDFAGGAFVLDNDAAFTTAQLNVHSNDSNPAFLIFSKTRGTHASPLALQNNDGIGSIFWGAFGAGYSYPLNIRAVTSEAWDGTHHGARFVLETNKKADAGLNDYTFGDDGSLTVPGLFIDTSLAAMSLGGNAAATADEVNEGIVIDNDAGSRIRLIRHSNDFSSPVLNIEKSRGTHASPTAILSGDSLGSVAFRAHDGSSFTTGPLISSGATETWDATHHGASLTLRSFKNAAGIGGLGGNSLILDQDGSTTLPGALTVPSTITANGQFALGITALTPAASVALDFAPTASPTKSLAVSQATTFTTSNLSAGVTDVVYLTTDGSARTPTFPAGWTWVGSGAPTSLAASTTNVLTLTSTTTADSGVLASLSPQNATVNLSTDVSGGPLSIALGGTGTTTGTGLFVSYAVATSGTTITSPAGAHQGLVVACGAGGGGGGTTTAAASAAAGGGGAAGACAPRFYTGLSPLTAYTIAIGTAGLAGTNAGGNGGNGGDTTFTDGVTLLTGKGGLGGSGEAAGTVSGDADGGAGVISTNGNPNTAGEPGTSGFRFSGTFAVAGNGGSCVYGSGGRGSGSTGAGAAAIGQCSGGAGGNVENNSTAVAGGAGTGGVLVVWWYQ